MQSLGPCTSVVASPTYIPLINHSHLILVLLPLLEDFVKVMSPIHVGLIGLGSVPGVSASTADGWAARYLQSMLQPELC
jgi:hypothetical protein